MKIKQLLYNRCIAFVEKQESTIKTTISSNQNSLESESKSSAGDKHETGRAMLQLEMEKAGKQLNFIQQTKELLEKISLQPSNLVRLGSLVTTSNGVYFLAVSVGVLTVKNQSYFVVSSVSPIGKQLLGKKVGESIFWNKDEINILKIE